MARRAIRPLPQHFLLVRLHLYLVEIIVLGVELTEFFLLLIQARSEVPFRLVASLYDTVRRLEVARKRAAIVHA